MPTDAPNPAPPASAGAVMSAPVMAMLALVMSIVLSNLGQWSLASGGKGFEGVQWISLGGATLGTLALVAYLVIWSVSPAMRQQAATAWETAGRVPLSVFGGVLLALGPVQWAQILVAGGNGPAQICFAFAGLAALCGGLLLLRALRPAKPDVAA